VETVAVEHKDQGADYSSDELVDLLSDDSGDEAASRPFMGTDRLLATRAFTEGAERRSCGEQMTRLRR
jgi:hypothetical protein